MQMEEQNQEIDIPGLKKCSNCDKQPTITNNWFQYKDKQYCFDCYSFCAPLCASCQLNISSGEIKELSDGRTYHPECLICRKCKTSHQQAEELVQFQHQLYHLECLNLLCVQCQQSVLSGNSNLYIDAEKVYFIEDDFRFLHKGECNERYSKKQEPSYPSPIKQNQILDQQKVETPPQKAQIVQNIIISEPENKPQMIKDIEVKQALEAKGSIQSQDKLPTQTQSTEQKDQPQTQEQKPTIQQQSSSSLKYYPYEVLISKNVPADVDKEKKEQHLSDKDFHDIFKNTKEEFYKIPKWKRDTLKKDKKLF